MSLKANLKKYFLSPWFYILLVPELALSVVLYLSSNHVSKFVYNISAINVYLTVFVSVFSVYAAQSIRELEWSIRGRFSVIARGLISAVIFCLAAVVVPLAFISAGCILNGTPAVLWANYILYILSLTAAQILFLSPLGFLLGSVIKNKAAYVFAVLLSAIFTPFLQTALFDSCYRTSFLVALTNLINLSWDDPTRIKYAGYGMPFNIETILSWIITVLCGLVFVFLTLGVKRCFKVTGTAALCVLIAAAGFSGAYFTELYFDLSPVISHANYQENYSDSGEYAPPKKIDTANGYSDPSSPVISRYDMKLDTGNTVKNHCELELKINGNSSVKLRLDQCFEIHSLTVDGENADYDREGDYFTVSLNPSKEVSVINTEYSGRINYADGLHNKTDFCDFTGGFLSELFAWYPKLLSAQNTEQPKDFTVEINAVNSFVTNLDGYALHPSGRQTVKGEKKDILFYLGYIGETSINGTRVIIPLEYLNSTEALNKLDVSLSRIKNDAEAQTYKNLFIGRYTGPYFNDFQKTETTMISYEELKLLVNNWLDEVGASESQKGEAAERIAALEDVWDDSLAEKLNDYEYFNSKEVRAVYNLTSVLSDVWMKCTFRVSSEELDALDTITVIPFSYNSANSMYLFENCIIVTEGSIE